MAKDDGGVEPDEGEKALQQPRGLGRFGLVM